MRTENKKQAITSVALSMRRIEHFDELNVTLVEMSMCANRIEIIGVQNTNYRNPLRENNKIAQFRTKRMERPKFGLYQ